MAEEEIEGVEDAADVAAEDNTSREAAADTSREAAGRIPAGRIPAGRIPTARPRRIPAARYFPATAGPGRRLLPWTTTWREAPQPSQTIQQ